MLRRSICCSPFSPPRFPSTGRRSSALLVLIPIILRTKADSGTRLFGTGDAPDDDGSSTPQRHHHHKGACRRWAGFERYVVAVQYHGRYFLGFVRQPDNSSDGNLPLPVETRLRNALAALVQEDNVENLQVSSRTDRGVHALYNTCHVDLRPRHQPGTNLDTDVLRRGWNHYLQAQSDGYRDRRRGRHSGAAHHFGAEEDAVRVLRVSKAPVRVPNPFYGSDNKEPTHIDWHARYNAVRRTYLYRLTVTIRENSEHAIPFESGLSWRIVHDTGLDVADMQTAAARLVGTHDFTSLRGARCQRSSPVVRLIDVTVEDVGTNQWTTNRRHRHQGKNDYTRPQTVHITVTGNAFLYRQVRNMVGCLVHVGKGEGLDADGVAQLLEDRDRTQAPPGAPAHGLFLVDVGHQHLEDDSF